MTASNVAQDNQDYLFPNQQMKLRLTALIMRQRVSEYKRMLNKALQIGIKPEEVKELIYRAAPHIGLERVFDFSQITNDILVAHGLLRVSQCTLENGYGGK
ncbi:carboxymuconolactone decarboxylase family protein [Listeria grandensis]|uniref:Carboxymuconolactone decarboxylase family protein n=1 Tax=Listeria grandensis TaxID=1494963 RepID=A0A7X0Y4E1_9LIST|nr:carboxymuconolactone decarboxylase family protein [Listeria grandensis]MBC1475411.1 carboxymuconolactone decarboxylase family protein [Listeria grandensis]MBC1936719.1 carboxymuconolactone decarboxylase family protein [Listeria grandensis]